jgi:hypothetical protein
MTYEKIIVRENGDKVKLLINFFLLSLSQPTYKINVYLCGKGKRKYNEIKFDSYDYRRLGMEGRKDFEYQEYLKHVTEDELHEAKLEVWQKLIPIKGDHF